MSDKTATELRTTSDYFLNLRRQRAMSLAGALMRELHDFLPDEFRREIADKIIDLFTQKGIEILTDADRQRAGLPPRDERGWTHAELVALEHARLEMLIPKPFVYLENPERKG